MTTARNKHVKYPSSRLDREHDLLTFGQLLSAHRLSEEISQAHLARKLNISRQKLNDFENGRRFPNLRVTADIAASLNEHVPTWLAVVLQEMLRRDNLKFRVTVAG